MRVYQFRHADVGCKYASGGGGAHTHTGRLRGPVWSCVVQLKPVLKRVAPLALQRTLGKVPDWTIGVYGGDSPLDMQPVGGVANPILTYRDVTEPPAIFIADPFAVEVGGTWYLYFESVNARTRRGEIGLATSTDLRSWTYRGVALAEPFHLSYPYVFEWDGGAYMVPESGEDRSVRLYRAGSGMDSWDLVDIVLKGSAFHDSTLFRHEGLWWMFTETNERGLSDTLSLYYASELRGPWMEHPRSPVVQDDAGAARPAGRVVEWGGRLIRFAQDCRVHYGAGVNAFEVVTLTAQEYEERPAKSRVLQGSGAGWNELRMHHLDAHRMADGRWLAFVDGSKLLGPTMTAWSTAHADG